MVGALLAAIDPFFFFQSSFASGHDMICEVCDSDSEGVKERSVLLVIGHVSRHELVSNVDY